MILTIDGPAASGKSSVARALALKLHYYYLNSGMLYRALGYCLMHNAGVPLQLLRGCTISARKKCLESLRYTYDIKSGVMAMFIGDQNVTALLKDPIIDKAASLVGENKEARTFLMAFQRSLINDYDIVAEGRDAGSVVFPQANVKFFLTAHPDVRALRWLKDKKDHGNTTATFEDAVALITERDKRDSDRTDAPLHIHADNLLIDNSRYTMEQTLEKMLEIISENQKK